MVTIETARKLALELPGAEERDHFGRPSFRVNKRIFSTLWVPQKRMVVGLSLIDQSVFHAFNPAVFYPVTNKWGLKGATFVELDLVMEEMLLDALNCAYNRILRKK